MNDSRELCFTDPDHKLYGKLDAANQDLASTCAFGEFILKKGWRAKPWSRGTIYLQQSAFVTAMVTSYMRAFSKSRGWPKFPDELLNLYDQSEHALHERVRTLRDQVYAHSDSVSYEIKPWKSEFHSDITMSPVFEFPHADIETLQAMCWKMRAGIDGMMAAIKAKYI